MTRQFHVVVTPRAAEDIAALRAYLLERSPAGAENVRRAIVATFEHLGAFPLTGKNRPELNVRSTGVARYSYSIYFRISEDNVEIIHLRDDRRAPLEPGDI